jgi:hypothetical protein
LQFFYYATWHDLTPSKINDEDPIYIYIYIIKILKYYYVATWHFVMGYNIVANNDE